MNVKRLVILVVISLLALGTAHVNAEDESSPYVIYGWVFYENGTHCNNPVVDIDNTDNGNEYLAETHDGYHRYQIALADGTDLNSSEMLQFNVQDSAGTQFKTLDHTVMQTEVDDGGLFELSITLEMLTAPPTVDSITITPDDDGSPGVQIDPNPGGLKTVTVTAVVSDPDGYADISTVTISDINPDPAQGDPSPVGLSYQSGSGNTATYTGTFEMQFYDEPTDYTVTVTAEDTGGLSDDDSAVFSYTSCNAINLDAGTITFGPVNPGDSKTVSGDEDMGTVDSPTVQNTGNVEIDVSITGTDMTSGSDSITKDNIEARVATLDYLNLGDVQCFDVNMAAGESSLENVDFILNVPYATPAGDYAGSVTLTASNC